jgi:DNA-binding CsgD family transcriptional regulator
VPRSVRLASDLLVGRDEELRGALTVLSRLSHDRPAVVTVSGPAGIGKTRFVTEVADRLRADGVRVLTGACLDLRAGAPPYVALIAAFRSADPPAVQVLDALTGAVDMRRSRLFELLRSTTVALARRRPTVLVIEDVHWSDRITRDALRYLVAMAREGRWALVVTVRDDELAARPAVQEFLDALDRDAVLRVTLDALTGAEVAAQITGITAEPPRADYAARLHQRTGGIPLLVEEVLAAEQAGVSGVPDHLRNLFLARIARLGARTARAVDVVAVVGDRCDERLVSAVLSTDPAAAAAALDRAVAVNVLVTDGPGYRTRHELFREAVYDALPPARRRRLHARVAIALAAAPRPDPAALAHHWYQADQPARAAQANLDAAALADRVHAPGEVHTYLNRVLEHFDALPVERATALCGRAALLARAAEAACLSGSFGRAVELAEQCLESSAAPAELAVRWERLARYYWISADGAGAEHAHQRSIAVLPDDAPAGARAQVLAGYAWYLAMASRTGQARRRSEQALAAADDTDDPLDRCRALLAWGLARADEHAGLAALWEARDLAIRCDSGDELGRAHAALHLALRRLGRPPEREQVLRDGLGHAAAHGLHRSYALVMTYLLAELLLDLGRWDEAESVLDHLVGGQAVGLPAMFGNAFRARLAAARGDQAVVERCARQVTEPAAGVPQQPYPAAIAWCALAELCLWEGAVEQALAHAGRATVVATDPVSVAQAAAIHARALADLAGQARRQGQARPAEPDTTTGSHQVLADPHPLIAPFAAMVRAETSRRDGRRDPAPWRDAVAAWDEAADPYRGAYCRWRLADALLATRAGRPEARRSLAEAHEVAARLEARPLLEAIRGLAAAARISVAADPPSDGPAGAAAELGLTHRELEIVPLLTAGRTNAEIAEALVISPRTVGVHVSRILRKLGATRRTEAADIARRRGLVS